MSKCCESFVNNGKRLSGCMYKMNASTLWHVCALLWRAVGGTKIKKINSAPK